MSRTARRWIFTLGKEFIDGAVFTELPERISFAIWQLERAPSTGYLHFQGYVRMKNACTLGQVKSHFPQEIHLEQAKGTEEQCITYCTKEESKVDGPWELGNRSNQGSRSDLKALINMVKENKTDTEIFNEYDVEFSRYKRYIDNARGAFILPIRQDDFKVYYLYGCSGSGKTHWAWQQGPLYQPIITDSGKVWWDGYHQENIILLDDYRGKIPFGHLLTLLDKYPKRGEIKGGTIALNYKRVIITSNDHWTDWKGYEMYSHTDWEPMMRRCQTGGIYRIMTREDCESINFSENQ